MCMGKRPFVYSSPGPRVFYRVYSEPGRLFGTLQFLERLLGVIFYPRDSDPSTDTWGMSGYIPTLGKRMGEMITRDRKHMKHHGHLSLSSASSVSTSSHTSSSSASSSSSPGNDAWGVSSAERKWMGQRISEYEREEGEEEEEEEEDTQEVDDWDDSDSDTEENRERARYLAHVSPLPPLPLTKSTLQDHLTITNDAFSLTTTERHQVYARKLLDVEPTAPFDLLCQSDHANDACDSLKEEMSPLKSPSHTLCWSYYTALTPASSLDGCMVSTGYHRIMSSKSAGCNECALRSEALSAEVLFHLHGLAVSHCEMELKYTSKDSPLLDYMVCNPKNGEYIGVSVTRAIADSVFSQRGSPFSRRQARTLLARKLLAIHGSRSHISAATPFRKAVLHIWCATLEVAQMLHAEADAMLAIGESECSLPSRKPVRVRENSENTTSTRTFSPTLIQSTDIMLLLTVTDFGGTVANLKYSYMYNGRW